MPPEIHPLDAVKRASYNLSLKTDGDARYYENFWNDEATTRRKKAFDERAKKRENEYYTRVISKIQALKHSDVPVSKPKKVDTRTPYEIALDKAAHNILATDPEYQAWIADQPRRRKLMKDAMSYLDSVHHYYWKIKGFGDLGIKEPRNGDPTLRHRWEEYRSENPNSRDSSLVKLSSERQKLANMFKDAQERRVNRKTSEDEFMKLVLGSMGTE